MVAADYKKIVIRMPNWLGDAMMATAFVDAVMTAYPHASVDLIVRSSLADLPYPRRGRIIPYDSKDAGPIRFGLSLRPENYDAFFVLPPSFSSALMAFASQVPARIGYRHEGRGLLLRPAHRYTAVHRTQHLIQEYLDLLGQSIPMDKYHPRLSIDAAWLEQHGVSEAPDNSVVLAPGAIYGSAKQWPVEYFAEVAVALAKTGHSVIVVGSKTEAPLADIIKKSCSSVLDLCGKTTLPQLAALLKRSALLISNDSGVMHVMAAIGNPQIALFGSTSPTWTGPHNKRASIVYRKLSCSPCFEKVCPLVHKNCLREITPSSIAEMAEAIFKSPRG